MLKFLSQPCLIEIKIIDSLDKSPLDFVSISFKKHDNKNWDLLFSDQDGLFKTIQNKGVEIKYNMTYLGYNEQSMTIYCDNGAKLTYIIEMTKSAVKLDEVIITDKFPAIIEKKDTVIYSVADFVTGNEEKLKEVLNKLPGIHDDRNNEVTLNGEKVKELLVENDKFFTGDPSLAVKYIPADAVERIEVLEKYNHIKVLRSASINDKLILNIKLKKDKKKLIFGELIAGTNIVDRHVLHKSAFYYSPTFTANNISDYKSTNDEVLTSKELFRILAPDMDNYDPKSRPAAFQQISQLNTLLSSGNAFNQTSIFGIQQLRYRMQNKCTLEGIFLGFDKKNQSSLSKIVTFPDKATDNQYSFQNFHYNTLHKHADISLTTDPEKKYFLSYNFRYSENNSSNIDSSTTRLSTLSNILNLALGQDNRSIEHRAKYIQQWNKRLQSILIFNLTNHNYSTDGIWHAEGLFIPTLYNKSAAKVEIKKIGSAPAYNTYALTRANYNINYKSKSQVFLRYESSNQLMNNQVGSKNGIPSHIQPYISIENLTGVSDFDFYNLSGGGRYIFSDQINELNVGVDYQSFSYQLEERNIHKTDRLSPFLDISRNINRVGRLGFVYQFDFKMPTLLQLNPFYTSSLFTAFSKGSLDVVPEQKHSFTLSRLKSKTLKGMSQNMSLLYSKTSMPIITAFNFDNQNFVETFYNSRHNKNDLSLHFIYSKIRNKMKIFNHVLANYSHFYQRVKDTEVPFKQFNVLHRITISKEWKNVEISGQVLSSARNIPLNNQTSVWMFQPEINAEIKYFANKNWSIQTEVEYTTLISKNLNQTTFPINMQLQYKTSNEKYKINFVANNILDQKNQASTRVDIFSSTITNQRIFPRYFYISFVYVY
ncbi:MAG: hypothetical protein IPJ13_28850 [Saprospiraceae bacterium]|nr:hypothetical protein [Saprospiraceae bacterium]